jgi:hypothetical protein
MARQRRGNHLARRKKKKGEAEGGEDAPEKGSAKHFKKQQKRFRELEEYIDAEFQALSDEYDREELEELRWDYRLDQMGEYKLTEEEIRYFVAEKEARQNGLPPPELPASLSGSKGGQQAAAAAAAAPQQEYVRKSDVDLALVDKYLERHIERDSTAEMAKIYKETFGEDLHVPEKLSLVDLTYNTGAIKEAHRLTKTEVFGTPEEIAAEKAAAEGKAKVETAPTRKESKALKFATAYKRGVPEGLGTGEKYRMSNPARVWSIPKRFAGKSVGRYYVLFAVNLVLFFLLLIPRIFLWPILTLLRLLKRFVAPRVAARVAPRIQGIQQKLADPAKAPAEKPSNQG